MHTLLPFLSQRLESSVSTMEASLSTATVTLFQMVPQLSGAAFQEIGGGGGAAGGKGSERLTPRAKFLR